MDQNDSTRRWQGRPALAWLTRITIFVVPFISAMVVAFLLSSRLPVATSVPAQIVRWVAIIAVSTVAMMGVERVARRLLPLSVLLKLTLVFPDHAPSRFAVAMRTGTTAQLRTRLEAAREVPSGETRQEAAERLLELVGLLSHHDRLTRGHSERVRAYSHLIGEELGLTESELDKLRWAALLHDVGKVAIDTEILNKPSRLTDEEFATIKTHPDEGRALVAPLAGWLGESIQAVWQHHERFDGTGYPQGLAGTDISFAARVVTVADSYDVMTSARSYKKPMSADAARSELAVCSGTQFDPIVVRAFLNVSLGRLRLMTGPLAWFAQLALFEPSGVVHAGVASGGSSTAGGSAATAGSTVASTATAAAASGGTASVASTVAATAAGIVASTVGIAATAPSLATPVASAAAPVTVAAPGDHTDLPAPQDSVIVLDEPGDDAVDTPTLDEQPVSAAAPLVDQIGAAPATDATDPSTTTAPAATTTTVAPRSSTTTTATTNDTNDTPPPLRAAPAPVATSTTVRPTTTAPPSDTTTATTVPTATTTTTTTTVPPTSTTTTTTTVPSNGELEDSFLGSAATDMAAPAFHRSTNEAPPNVALPNYDTDRDSAPGALVQKGVAGIDGTDPTKLLKFRVQPGHAFVIDHDLHVELYVAAKDFARKDVDVEVGLYHCTAPSQCTLLGSDDSEVKNAKDWRKRKFHFHGVAATVGVDEWIEIRVAVLDGSDDDAWFAFGTDRFAAKLTADHAD